MNQQDFVGTWRLVSMEAHPSEGQVTYPFGRDARGFIIYSADGYMSVVIFTAGRQILGTSDLLAGSEEQIAAAARTYISYAGRYEVQRERVQHYVEASLLPDWAGTTQERLYRFDGQRLTLSTNPMPLGGKQMTVVLVWERATQIL